VVAFGHCEDADCYAVFFEDTMTCWFFAGAFVGSRQEYVELMPGRSFRGLVEAWSEGLNST